ncbi:MAG: methyltransferase domain-containing protein [Tissierellia bacterium]|nr:methyltransferase domain-containing protein [Tissierellia bacterium]
MYKYFTNPVDIAKRIMTNYVKEGDIVLDCTVGNGNDTIHLAKLVGDSGKVYGFDIQSIALKLTREKLEKENLLNRVFFIHDSHENIDNYISEKLSLIVYNLGYLPGGDKSIKTNPITTIKSLKKAIKLLKSNGLLLITCYTGHSGGKEEKEKVKAYLGALDQKYANVLEFNFINQKNNPPVLYGVEKF